MTIVAFTELGWTTFAWAAGVILIGYYIWPLLNRDLSHIPGPRPVPVFGTLLPFLSKGIGPGDLECVKKYGKVYRVLEGRKPSMVVADPDMIKHILIKDFGDFSYRQTFPLHDLFAMALFQANGDRWRRFRHHLTPSFTTGKLKQMMVLVQTCIQRFNRNIADHVGKSEAFNVQKLTSAFAMEVLSSTAFGIDVDTQRDTNNPLILKGLQLDAEFQPTNPMFLLYFFAPFLVPVLSMFGITMLTKEIFDYFEEFLWRTLSARKNSTKEHNDLLQMLIHAKRNDADEKIKGLTSREILAQALGLFLAGYGSTGATMGFFLYQMAENPGLQKKVYQEIKTVMEDNDEVTYEAISKMTLLDQCIQETLRKYPVLIRLNRIAQRDVYINGTFIPKDTVVKIPVYALHYDPDTWSNPHKFDPERFSTEAKSERNPILHQPFGTGPRHCIGKTFALMEMKMALIDLISSFRFLPAKEPLELNFGLLTEAKDGIWIKVNER